MRLFICFNLLNKDEPIFSPNQELKTVNTIFKLKFLRCWSYLSRNSFLASFN